MLYPDQVAHARRLHGLHAQRVGLHRHRRTLRGSGQLRYARWSFLSNLDGDDALTVSVSNDGGATWVEITRYQTTTVEWEYTAYVLDDFVVPSADMQVRFSIADTAGETLLEGLIDDVRIAAGQ